VAVQRALLLSRDDARVDPAGARGAEEEGTDRAAAAPHSGQRGTEAGPALARRSARAAEELRARGGAAAGSARPAEAGGGGAGALTAAGAAVAAEAGPEAGSEDPWTYERLLTLDESVARRGLGRERLQRLDVVAARLRDWEGRLRPARSRVGASLLLMERQFTRMPFSLARHRAWHCHARCLACCWCAARASTRCCSVQRWFTRCSFGLL
jgi:hypothetical protein